MLLSSVDFSSTMLEEGIEKLHGLNNTGMTMHERFTMLAQASVFRRGKRNPFLTKTRSHTMNGHYIETFANQLENQFQQSNRGMPFRGRGRGRGVLRRSGSEGSIRSMPGLRRGRSNSFGNMSQVSKNQSWRRSNGNLSSMNGSVFNGGASVHSQGYWIRGAPGRVMRGGAPGRMLRGRGRGRIRGRTHLGRVTNINSPQRGRGRGPRGVGRRGLRRLPGAGARGRGRGAPRGRGRGRGMTRTQTPKPVPTKEELDAQLEQYMAGTKAALDKELDEYMRNAMDFD